MADKFLGVNAAAELVLNSDSDEGLLENESDAEDIDDMDISDESSNTDDAPSTSQAAQSGRGGRRTEVRGRNNYVWCPATRQPQRIGLRETLAQPLWLRYQILRISRIFSADNKR